MSKLTDFKVLCFDVYGTLIDWESGIIAALQPLLAGSDAAPSKAEILAAVHRAEAAQQAATPTMKYTDVLAAIHPQVARDLGLPAPAPDASRAFGLSVGAWPAFPDTVPALRRLAAAGLRLVVLSNVDADGIARSVAGPLAAFPFDLVLTAERIGSYKPARANFDHMLAAVRDRFGAAPDQVLPTAQSQFHDHHPAKDLGLKTAWIDRAGAVMGNMPVEKWDWKFATLADMADAVEAELRG